MIRIDFRKEIDTTTEEWNRAYEILKNIQRKHDFKVLDEKQTIKRFRDSYNDEEFVLCWLNTQFDRDHPYFYDRNDPNSGWIQLTEKKEDWKDITATVPDLVSLSGEETVEVKRKYEFNGDWDNMWFCFKTWESIHDADRVLVVSDDHRLIAELDLDSRIDYPNHYELKVKKLHEVSEALKHVAERRFIKC